MLNRTASHARRYVHGVPEPRQAPIRLRGIPQRTAPRRPGRAAGLRVHLGRGAPLHRLHHVPRRAAIPVLHGWADRAGQARLDGGGAAVARPGARGRRVRDAGQPQRWPGSRGRRSRAGQGGVRRIPAGHERVPPALQRVGRTPGPGAGGRIRRVRRRVDATSRGSKSGPTPSALSRAAPTPPPSPPSPASSSPSWASAS